jgi:Glutathione synthase/Ribosomal protein S6 modification enzyme (glutaminyl transferase)
MKKILIITNKDDITVDFVIKELQTRKLSYYRLNTEEIPENISVNFNFNSNEFELIDKVKNIKVHLLEFDSVYFRRPVLNKLDYIQDVNVQELNYLKSELVFILEGIYKTLRNKYWLNNIYDIREAENKIYQLQIAQEVGFKVPDALISNSSQSVNLIRKICNNDCVIKPIKSGNMNDLEHPKAIFTNKMNEEQFEKIDGIESFPIFLEKNIHKKFDLRCTVVGNDVFTAEIYSQDNDNSKIDWRKARQALEHKNHELPYKIKDMCIELTRMLHLNYSAIDLILDEHGDYIFLEINPNGQWAWIEKRLGFPISKKIVDLLVQG